MIIPKEDPVFIALCFLLFVLIVCSLFGNNDSLPTFNNSIPVSNEKYIDNKTLEKVYN